MQYAIFGMKFLNITQGNNSNYTHKGINALDLAGEDKDKCVYRAKMRLKCTNVLEYTKTGFANTCFFSPCDDKGNLVEVNTPAGIKKLTLAFSHDDYVRVEKGKIYNGDDIIYKEGTKGNADGNHIHAEVCFDFVTNKIKKLGSAYYRGSAWVLPDAVPIHQALYIDPDYTQIIDSKGYNFKNVTEGEKMKLIEEHQRINWLGSTVDIYKQKPNQKIGMMSAKEEGKENWQARQTIDKIDNDFIHYCKINCNFFDMRSGQHYGVEQSFENDFAPKQDEWYCLYINKEGKPSFCLSSDYWCNKNDVILACSPFAILRHNGEDLKLTSKGANQSLQSYTNNTLLLYFSDGSYAFMVTDNKLTSLQCLDFAKSYGAIGVYELDGSGSSQMIVNGCKIRYTGRPIANVLTFYTVSGEPTPGEPCTNCEDLKQKNDLLMTENRNLREENVMLNNRLKRIKNILEER